MMVELVFFPSCHGSMVPTLPFPRNKPIASRSVSAHLSPGARLLTFWYRGSDQQVHSCTASMLLVEINTNKVVFCRVSIPGNREFVIGILYHIQERV